MKFFKILFENLLMLLLIYHCTVRQWGLNQPKSIKTKRNLVVPVAFSRVSTAAFAFTRLSINMKEAKFVPIFDLIIRGVQASLRGKAAFDIPAKHWHTLL